MLQRDENKGETTGIPPLPCMRFCRLLIFVVTISMVRPVTAEPHNWGSPTNGIQLSVRLKGGSEIGTNQPVRLIMRFKNGSHEAVTKFLQPSSEMEDDYAFTVTTPSGRDISLSKKTPRSGPNASAPLNPGLVAETEYNLSTQCKFDELGQYKIVARVRFYTGKGPFQVVSNPLTVRVAPQSANSLVAQPDDMPFFHFILDPDDASEEPRIMATKKHDHFEIVTDPTTGNYVTVTTNGIVTLNTKTGWIWLKNIRSRLSGNQIGSVYLLGDTISILPTNAKGFEGGRQRLRINKETGDVSSWSPGMSY